MIKQEHSERPTSTASLAKVGSSTSALLKREEAEKQSFALRNAAAAGQVMPLGRALMRVDLREIERMNAEREMLNEEVERLRRRYADLLDLFASKERQKLELDGVESTANRIKERLQAIPVFKNIGEAMAEQEVATIRELATLVQWADAQINTSKGLSNEQVATVAEAIAVQYKHLLIEDIAAAFRQAVLKPDAPIMRLDAQVLMLWVKKHDDARSARIAEQHERKHQMSKG
jgi:hypothetical protein